METDSKQVSPQPLTTETPNDQLETTPKKKRSFLVFLDFPRQVWFILSNEFCERFAFYGYKAILPLYLNKYLQLSEDTSVAIIHSFVFLAYLTPLFGGWLADSVIGKYWTIVSLSVIYCIGQGLAAVTAIPGVTGNPPHWWGIILSLFLVAVGTGGIKPCVSSFGGDQFSRNDADLLASYFGMFYLSINIGSTISTFLTPILSDYVGYAIAFAIPAILLVFSLIIFAVGKRWFRIVKPSQNIYAIFVRVFYHAIRERKNTSVNGTHWLDKAKAKMPEKHVEDTKSALKVCLCLIPLIAFWSLYDQNASRWVFQASQMNRHFWSLGELNPGLVQTMNPVFVMILVPLFDMFIYKLIAKKYDFKPLRKITVGFLFTTLAFLISALLQVFVELFPGQVHVSFQAIQYFILSIGEILVSITGLEFAYSQAPKSMKSVMQSFYLLTIASGNVIVVVIASIPILPDNLKFKQVYEFTFFAGFMIFATLIFLAIVRKYKYQTHLGDDKDEKELVVEKESIELQEQGTPGMEQVDLSL